MRTRNLTPLAAVLADPVDLKGVPRGREVILAADFLLQLADFRREELDGTPAIGADHVVVAAPVVLMFVTGDPVMEGNFAGEATLGQQFQGTVYGGVSDARIFFLHQPMEFVGGEMVAGLQKCAQDRIALGSLFQADALEMTVQDVLRLADHLAGKRRLVVDALLEHGLRVRITPGHLENEIHFQPRPHSSGLQSEFPV